MKEQEQLQEFNKQRAAWLKDRFTALEEAEPCEDTPAMLEIKDRINGVVREPSENEKFEFKPVVKEVSKCRKDIYFNESENFIRLIFFLFATLKQNTPCVDFETSQILV